MVVLLSVSTFYTDQPTSGSFLWSIITIIMNNSNNNENMSRLTCQSGLLICWFREMDCRWLQCCGHVIRFRVPFIFSSSFSFWHVGNFKWARVQGKRGRPWELIRSWKSAYPPVLSSWIWTHIHNRHWCSLFLLTRKGSSVLSCPVCIESMCSESLMGSYVCVCVCWLGYLAAPAVV